MISPLFQLVVLSITILFILWVVTLLKKRKLELKYTLLWFFCSMAMLTLALFPELLNFIAKVFGVYSATNALFAIISLFLILLCLSLTVIVSKQNTSIKQLAQRIAVIEKQTERTNSKRSI